MLFEVVIALFELIAAVFHLRRGYNTTIGNGLGGRRFPPGIASDGTMLSSRTMTTLRDSDGGTARKSKQTTG